jgi:hypothetical protein
MAPWRNRGVSWEELKAVEASLDAAERKRLDRLTDMELFRQSLRAITILHITICSVARENISIVPITELGKLAVQLAESYKVLVEAWKSYDELVRLKGNAPVK